MTAWLSTALIMSKIVRAATDAAVSASISTPVFETVLTAAVIRTLVSSRVKSTSTPVRRGWQRGMRSLVRLAPMTAAMRATGRASPLGSPASVMRAMTSGRVVMSAVATARRFVTSLSPTSTMWAAPVSSMCVRFSRLSTSSAYPRGREEPVGLGCVDGREEDEVGALRIAVEQVGAGAADEDDAVVGEAGAPDLEFARRRGLVESGRQLVVGGGTGVRFGIEAEESRSEEHLEADERAHRVAGQGHPSPSGQPTAPLGPARPHGDGFEDHCRVRVEVRGEPDDFACALRDPAGGDDEVGVGGGNGLKEKTRIVGHVQGLDLGAEAEQAGGEGDPVGVVDARLSACGDLVAGGEDEDARRVTTSRASTPQAAATPRRAG